MTLSKTALATVVLSIACLSGSLLAEDIKSLESQVEFTRRDFQEALITEKQPIKLNGDFAALHKGEPLKLTVVKPSPMKAHVPALKAETTVFETPKTRLPQSVENAIKAGGKYIISAGVCGVAGAAVAGPVGGIAGAGIGVVLAMLS